MKYAITDDQALNGAKTRFENSIPVFDNGLGDLYIHRDSMGIIGISRSMTWEEAYETSEDEFFQRVTNEELIEEYGEDLELVFERDCFSEAYGFSPNNGMYHKDLNGDTLELLTVELANELEISIDLSSC